MASKRDPSLPPSKRGGVRPGAGRKPHPIDLDVVRNVAKIGGTHEEIAAVLGMSYYAYQDRMEHHPEIGAAYHAGRDSGKLTLRRKQWHGAMNGNPTMLIWLGKQMLGQRDQAVLEVKEDGEKVALLQRLHDLLAPAAAQTEPVTIDQQAALPAPKKG